MLEGCFLYAAQASQHHSYSRRGSSGARSHSGWMGFPGLVITEGGGLSSLCEGSQAQVSPRTLCLHPSPEARFNGYSCHHDDSLLGGIIWHHPTLIKELEPGHRHRECVMGYATGASFQRSRFMGAKRLFLVHRIIKANSRNSSSVMSSLAPSSMFVRVKGPEFLWIEEYAPTGFNTNSCAVPIRIFYICEMNFNVFRPAKQAVYSFSDQISV